MAEMIRAWFDSGKAVGALIGDDHFHVRSPDYDVHDRIFIVQELSEWAGRDEERSRVVVSAVTDAVQQLLAARRVDEAIDLFTCVFLVAKYTGERPRLDLVATEQQLSAAQSMYEESRDLTERRKAVIEKVRARLNMALEVR